MRCISEIGGGTIRVCCLRYRSSSWEILFSSKPLPNLSSPGKTFVRSLHLSGVVGLRSTKRYPYGLRTASSYSLINQAVSLGYICLARVKILQFIPRILEKDQVMTVQADA